MEQRNTYTVPEVADKLGISKHRVYRRIHRGDIPVVPARAGSIRFLIPADALDRYITAGQGILQLTGPRIDAKPMLSTSEAAIATGYSVETIREMCYDGRLPFIKGKGERGHLRIPRDAVDGHTVEAEKPKRRKKK
jgi:excisionase family DNA binding protein